MADKNLPDKVDELLTEVVNKDPLLLASLSAVPYFGGTLATFFSAKWLEIYQERTDALLRQFSEHLSNLDEQAIRRDYFDTPEGMDLLIKATEASSKTRSDEKRDLIARILRGAASSQPPGSRSSEEYLNLVSDLTVQDLQVAHAIYRDRPNFEDSETWNRWEYMVGTEIGMDTEDLWLALRRLESAGLLRQIIGYKTKDGSLQIMGASVESGDEGTVYMITSTFEKLMRFLDLDT